MIHKDDIQDIYGLSPMQNGMLISHALDPLSSAYLEQFDFNIMGDVNPQCMEYALIQISDCHDILRTVFSYKKTDLPRQIVLKSWHPQMTVEDYRNMHSIEAAVDNFKEKDRARGFDLSRDVLLRSALLRVGDKAWRLILTFHHIVMDGWSLAPFFQELFGYYETAVNNQTIPAVKAGYQYSEYISWLQKQSVDEACAYWKQYLDGYDKPASIPTLGNTDSYCHARHVFPLKSDLVEAMEYLAKARQFTVNTLFQSAWGLLLQKYNYVRDVVFGTVVSGRPPDLPGVESMVGLFINTRPQRVQTADGDSFAMICSKVQDASFTSTAYEYYPLYEIQTHCELKNRLLDHVVAFENYPLIDQLRERETEAEHSLWFEDIQVYERANYDFSIIVNPGNEYSVTFIYNEKRYSRETIEGLERSLINLLEEACASPDVSVDELSLCSALDQTQIIQGFNGKRSTYPSDTTVDAYFKSIASSYPNDTALVWRNKEFTYAELDAWSDRLAALLRARGVSPGGNVGLLVGRSPEMIAGMLGIMKTGAVYVPLDINSSAERLTTMIKDTDIQMVCTQKELESQLPDGIATLFLDYTDNDVAFEDISQSHTAESPAYIMYTSGSTGKPKGVMITHRNIIHLVSSAGFMKFQHGQVMLQTCSPTFDPCTFEIWVALLQGGTLVVADEEDCIDSGRIGELLIRRKVNSTQLVTALFNRLCDQDPAVFSSLTSMMVGGDVLLAKYVRKVRESNPDLILINGYGPTENTTISTVHIINDSDLEADRVPIGRPLDNSSVYVMDQGLHLLPVGAIGEVCVGGDGVSLGYYNIGELTDQKFVQDTFMPDGRMYRTGDLARWLPDGTVDFLGRADSQVKFRGYRIEIGEIERTMANFLDLKEVTVQIQNVGQEKQLCAYYTSRGVPDIDNWQKLLASKLPVYMIPVFFIQMEALPLTPNFKIDKGALPLPSSIVPGRSERMQPASEMENIITDIFALVLETEAVPINYNFFELGVNSLNIITINNKLKAKLNRDIPLTVLFEHTSIARLAKYLQPKEVIDNQEEQDKEAELNESRRTLLQTDRLIRFLEG